MNLSAAVLAKWQNYFSLRDDGTTVEMAAARAGLSPSSAYRYERGEENSQGMRAAISLERGEQPAKGLGTIILDSLADTPSEVAEPGTFSEVLEIRTTPEGERALKDFAYFRYRYFGRKSMPWQVRAAEQVAIMLSTKDREYVVMNEPPGSGKSTLFSHDVLCWMIARDRTIRIQIGSRTERQARMYVGRIKRSLERSVPMLAIQEDKERGLAFDAEATLEGDYGVFRPGGREDLWRAEGLVVRQPSGVALDDKEPTVSAWGMDSGFLGGRFDLVVWDDLVDRKNTATVEARDKLAEWYFTEAETRLEPGGLFLLQGQRIAADDLYRTALDQVRYDGSTKYSHIVYPAHDESKCNNVHGKRARPWPEGCLLDPYRLPWHQLETIRHNNPRIFSVMYQQTDGMGIGGLVEQAWLEGGVDSQGYEAIGCYDLKRVIRQPPVGHEAMFSFITVDPSPTEYWGVLRWLYDPVLQVRYLMDIRRLKMRPDDWLWFDMAQGGYSGELVKMVADSDLEGNRVSHVIVEINAAQRWLLSQPHVQSWQSQERIHFIQHTTARNKLDPEYGVETIAPFFREGRVRIPWGSSATRIEFRPLIDELLRYPEGQTTDLVMSTWFSVLAVDHHYQGDRRRAWSKPTVPWFRSVRRGIA